MTRRIRRTSLDRRIFVLLTTMALAALPAAACPRMADDPPAPPRGTEAAAPPAANNGRGDAIVASGVLTREKDCQLLRTPSGLTYVLLGRLKGSAAGARVRVSGRRGGKTDCRQGPSLLVESVRPETYEPAARQPGQPAAPTGETVQLPNTHTDDAAMGKTAKMGKAKRMQVTGTLTREGVECPLLRTAKGAIYTLAGDLKGFQTGARVTVTGTRAEASICQQGTTIDVQDVRRAPR